jgi:hypothetical protein
MGLIVQREVDYELAVTLGKKISAGEITNEEAEATLYLMGGGGELPPEPEQEPDTEQVTDALAEADDVLAGW